MLKTSSRHVLKTSSRRLEDQQMFVGLALDLYLDEREGDLPPIPPLEDEKVKSEPEETIAERVKLNP